MNKISTFILKNFDSRALQIATLVPKPILKLFSVLIIKSYKSVALNWMWPTSRCPLTVLMAYKSGQKKEKKKANRIFSIDSEENF